MKKNTFKTILFPFLILIITVPVAFSQSGGFAGVYNRMGFGPVGMGMGNAMNTVPDFGIYAHYNPALAAFIDNTQIDLSVAALQFDRSLNAANVAFQLPPSAGINIGILQSGVSNFDGRSLSGLPTDRFSIMELNAFVAFGLNVSEKFKMGIASKLLYADFFETMGSSTGFGIDLGAIYQANERLNVGISIQDMLSAYNWDSSDVFGSSTGTQTDHFPTRVRLGSSYRLIDYGLLFSAEYEWSIQRAEARVTTDGLGGQSGTPTISTLETIRTASNAFRVGTSYQVHERITLRGGWEINDLEFISETSKPSAGFSLYLPLYNFDTYIDYAFIREPEGIAYMHVFALRLNL